MFRNTGKSTSYVMLFAMKISPDGSIQPPSLAKKAGWVGDLQAIEI